VPYVDAKPTTKIYCFHTNVNGAPAKMTDGRGALIWQARYTVWGNTVVEHWHRQHAPDASGLSAVHPLPQNLRMQGQYADVETGLCYNTFRYYDADVGRFISPDPIGLAGGMNLYRYAPNPIKWIDPLGWAYQSVDFSGSPDLYPTTGAQQNIVEITMQGSRTRDFTQANKAAGFTKTPDDFTWHHVSDFNPETGKTTMQLVSRSAHEATYPHAGSADQFAKHFGVQYDSPEAVAKAHEKGWTKGRTPKGC
jgi:RHS repeat-associated protein